MSRLAQIFSMTLVFFATSSSAADENQPTESSASDDTQQAETSQSTGATTDAEAHQKTPSIHWRKDPAVKRRPGSYIGGAMGYSQAHAWIEANDDHDELHYGPLHTFGTSFRVGDCFTEWFSLGFQLNFINAKQDSDQIGAFALLLDSTFYPWRGLGIRPSVGIGMGFAQGKSDWEFGGGGPGCLSFSLLYEFRVLRSFTVAPIAQVFWVAGGEFDGLFTLYGIEFTKWFATSTGN